VPSAAVDIEALAASATHADGADIVASDVPFVSPKELPDIADQVKGRLGDQAATVLGTVADGRVALVVSVTPALVARGVNAKAIVHIAAKIVGGGGGGRETMAQAGGRNPEALPDALIAAREAIVAVLTAGTPAAPG
jgi:alanyl-tRNA synthetase